MRTLVFLTDTLSNHSGGMEVHQDAFIKFFSKSKYKLLVITKKPIIQLQVNGTTIQDFPSLFDFSIWLRCLPDDTILFFNNLSWIRQTPYLRQMLPNSQFILRSGGNDILRAPFEDDSIPLSNRQK